MDPSLIWLTVHLVEASFSPDLEPSCGRPCKALHSLSSTLHFTPFPPHGKALHCTHFPPTCKALHSLSSTLHFTPFPPPTLDPCLTAYPGLKPAGETASQFYQFEYQDCLVLDIIYQCCGDGPCEGRDRHFIQRHSYPLSLCVWQLIGHFKSGPSPLLDHLLGAQTRHIRSTFWLPKCSGLSLGWEIKDPGR